MTAFAKPGLVSTPVAATALGGLLPSAAQAKQIADEQQEAAQDYQDAQWHWGAWGPWGPHWRHFGFGPSFGW
jgi:hypothetical protein